MKLHEQVSIWQETEVPEEIADEVAEKVKSGKITSVIDLYNQYPEYQFETENLDSTEERMQQDPNKEFSTFEILDENDEVIWGNSKYQG